MLDLSEIRLQASDLPGAWRETIPALCDEVEADRAKIKELEKTLEKACEYLADNNASRIDWKEYFSKRAREEMENGK